MKNYLLIPNNLNLIIIKKKKIYLYIYNKYYFFLIKININQIIAIKIKKLYLIKFINIKNNNYLFFIKNVIFHLNFLYFKKIKFSGKGFRIKKNKKKKNFKLQFNKSHLTILFLKKIILKKIKKSKFLFSFLNKKYLNYISKKIIKINKINIYTKRGLRYSRQLLKKKMNKKNILN
jgi:hypothetical protein